jgi:hypothetical protein
LRALKPSLTPQLQSHVGKRPVDAAPPYPIASYADLVEEVARLSFLNTDVLLFFRGQSNDYKSKAGASTFYPSIYRGDYVPQHELIFRFDTLAEACRKLKDLFRKQKVDGHRELSRKQYIQWSILQHYEVCETPLLDLTHSLRVACSFAQLNPTGPSCFVYAFSMPYITNRITINSEHNIALVRLLSICPPSAVRPYFQEGYLAGTTDITSEYENKTELDFKNRLVAKFEIPSTQDFWGSGFAAIPNSVLYPERDVVRDLCKEIETKVKENILPGQLGDFIQQWNAFIEEIISSAKRIDPEVHTMRSAISLLAEQERISRGAVLTFNEIRKFRNVVVHDPQRISQAELIDYLDRMRLFREHELRRRRQ